MGSVRLEESGEWSGGVPECRTAHAAHQQRVERGGRRPAVSRSFFKAAKRILKKQASLTAKRIFALKEFGARGGGRRPGVLGMQSVQSG